MDGLVDMLCLKSLISCQSNHQPSRAWLSWLDKQNNFSGCENTAAVPICQTQWWDWEILKSKKKKGPSEIGQSERNNNNKLRGWAVWIVIVIKKKTKKQTSNIFIKL